jgi:hypothetical protein
MKSIQMFFEMLTKYQIIKTELKKSFEAYKFELSIKYAEEIINKYKEEQDAILKS